MIERLPEELRPEKYHSLTDVYDYIAREHGERDAYYCLGKTLKYAEVDRLSTRFEAYLQHETNLQPGDRIALQLPNLLQFPVVLMGAVKAGLIVVNTNPLYTAHEMVHQFTDSGAKAIVILSAFCDKLQQILPQTGIETVIITELGDLQSPLKRGLLNFAARYIKRAVPRYQLPGSTKLLHCLDNQFELDETAGRTRGGHDVAVILYTGGTTGVSKGAMLSHSNLIANMMQLRSRCLLIIDDKTEVIGAPLPLYHSYAFLLHCLAMPYAGNLNLLMPNPRDLDSVIALFRKFPVSGFVGINTLFLALLRNRKFAGVDFSTLKFCGAGGMALSTSVAKEWREFTGCEIYEGYGLTECSPVVSVNVPGDVRYGTVGRLVPETEIKVVSEEGEELPIGEQGEAWIRGPQVMLGYWGFDDAQSRGITEDGWFKTGDYVELSDDGFISIVDRKKDMILVSGFNVFPNEIEDWVNQMPGVDESAAIGVPDERTGEAIKLFVVCSEPAPDQDALIAHCREGLTPYKVPRSIVYVDDLPKSIIGKIIRRKLRD